MEKISLLFLTQPNQPSRTIRRNKSIDAEGGAFQQSGMGNDRLRGTASEKRSLVLAAIALAVGGTIMLARHLDDWTRPAAGDQDPLPTHRAVAITMAQPFRLLEWRIYDFIHAFAAKTPADPDVVVLGIDEASLSLEDSSAFPEDIEASRPLQLMNRRFPWSREVYAHMIERLIEGGAVNRDRGLGLNASGFGHGSGGAWRVSGH